MNEKVIYRGAPRQKKFENPFFTICVAAFSDPTWLKCQSEIMNSYDAKEFYFVSHRTE